jgi:hypothetical protein
MESSLRALTFSGEATRKAIRLETGGARAFLSALWLMSGRQDINVSRGTNARRSGRMLLPLQVRLFR